MGFLEDEEKIASQLEEVNKLALDKLKEKLKADEEKKD